MSQIIIRDANVNDFSAIVEINAAEVIYTSAMDLDRLSLLDSLAAYHRVAVINQEVVGFLLAMSDNTPYINDNYNWFSQQYKKFLYIDRIVIKPGYQGQSIGTTLYKDAISFAQYSGIPRITCEIYSTPPNERSLAFHARLGFREVGKRKLEITGKSLSMQEKAVNILDDLS
jgi:hypothetical protein